MQPRRRAAVVLAAAALTALAGCSGSPTDAPASPSAPGTAASSAAPATPASPAGSATPDGSATPSLATLPAEQCLTGTWKLVRFVGASDQTYGTGEGGDLTVRFSDDAYTLDGAGQEPITVTLGGGSAALRVDGRAEGAYALKGSTATFTQRSASGGATIEAGGRDQRLTMKQVTSVVGLSGDAQVACTADAMTLTLGAVRLELGRA